MFGAMGSQDCRDEVRLVAPHRRNRYSPKSMWRGAIPQRIGPRASMFERFSETTNFPDLGLELCMGGEDGSRGQPEGHPAVLEWSRPSKGPDPDIDPRSIPDKPTSAPHRPPEPTRIDSRSTPGPTGIDPKLTPDMCINLSLCRGRSQPVAATPSPCPNARARACLGTRSCPASLSSKLSDGACACALRQGLRKRPRGPSGRGTHRARGGQTSNQAQIDWVPKLRS